MSDALDTNSVTNSDSSKSIMQYSPQLRALKNNHRRLLLSILFLIISTVGVIITCITKMSSCLHYRDLAYANQGFSAESELITHPGQPITQYWFDTSCLVSHAVDSNAILIDCADIRGMLTLYMPAGVVEGEYASRVLVVQFENVHAYLINIPQVTGVSDDDFESVLNSYINSGAAKIPLTSQAIWQSIWYNRYNASLTPAVMQLTAFITLGLVAIFQLIKSIVSRKKHGIAEDEH